MTSMNNNINQTVRRPESPHLKKNGCCDRRRSFHEYQQQQKYHDENPKRAQEDKLSSKIESKMKAQERQIGEADKEDEKEQQYREAVDSLGPYDVICGRGSLAFNNVGNRRFRVLISMNVDGYNDAEGRHRKGLFIGSLVNTLQHQIGVRFFKLKDGELIELTGRQIRQKVGHALRDVLAFQDSQFQQQQQLRKQQKLQHRPISSKTQSIPPTTKAQPGRTRPRTAMSPTQATLSSIRSRLNEIRAESDSIRLQRHAIPLPMPFSSTASRNSSNTSSRQNSAQSTTSRIGNGLTRQYSSQPNLFPPAGNNRNGQLFDSSSRSLPALSRGHNVQNEKFHQFYPRNDSANATFENSTTESRSSTSSSVNNRARDHRNSNNLYNRNNRLDRQGRQISFSLEGIDLAPIPIDEHQEPDDEVLTMLKF